MPKVSLWLCVSVVNLFFGVNGVNVVNVGERTENAMFTAYRHEIKGPGERGERCTEVFWLSRTWDAKPFLGSAEPTSHKQKQPLALCLSVSVVKRHGESDAVKRFEETYSPELVDGDVIFTDYEMIAGKGQPQQRAA